MESEKKTLESGSPCWVPSQDLTTESPYKKKENLTVRRVCELISFRVCFKSFLLHELSVCRIESVFRVIFFGLRLFIKLRKTCVANSAPFWCLHLLIRFLLDMIRSLGSRHILRTIGGKYCLQRKDEVVRRAFLAQLVLHQRSSVEVRKVLFLQESHSHRLLRL